MYSKKDIIWNQFQNQTWVPQTTLLFLNSGLCPSKNFWSKRLKKGWNLRPKSGSNDSLLGPTLSPSKNFWSKRLKKGWNLRPKSGSNDSILGPTLSPGSKLCRAKWPRLSRFLVPTLSPGQNFSLLGPTLSPGSKLGRAKWPCLSRFLVPTLSPGPILSPSSAREFSIFDYFCIDFIH